MKARFWVQINYEVKFCVTTGYRLVHWCKVRRKRGDKELRCGCCHADLMLRTDEEGTLSLVITNGKFGMPNFVVCDKCGTKYTSQDCWEHRLTNARYDFERCKLTLKNSPWKDFI